MQSPEQNLAIFKKFRGALRPGGTLLISDFLVSNDRSGPPFSLIFRSEMLVRTQEGGTSLYEDYEQWLNEAGFPKVDFQETGTATTLVYGS